MLYECNRRRFFFLKFGPLLFSLAFFLTVIFAITKEDPDYPGAILLAVSSGLFFALHSFTYKRVRLVTIGNMKIIVKEANGQHEYSWQDVESIVLDRFFGIYTLHLKNKEAIYFPPYEGVTWFFGDQSEMGAIISKMKRELDI